MTRITGGPIFIMTTTLIRAAVAASIALSLTAISAQAQTAGQINRLNSAMQVCNSPMGATLPECAQLRGQLGAQGLGGGGNATAAVGLLGSVLSAARSAPAAPPAPAVNAAGIQRAVADCVQHAAGDAAAIQACLTLATAPRPASPALPTVAANQGSGMAIHAAGQSYQACVAANPSGWQTCLSAMTARPPAPGR
jgi:hypothetical protein